MRPNFGGRHALAACDSQAGLLLASCQQLAQSKQNNLSCDHIRFIVSAKHEVHKAQQRQTAGDTWTFGSSGSTTAFVNSSNFLSCVFTLGRLVKEHSDRCGDTEAVGAQACTTDPPLDRKLLGVFEWMVTLLELPSIEELLEQAGVEPLHDLVHIFPAMQKQLVAALDFRHKEDAVGSAVELFRQYWTSMSNHGGGHADASLVGNYQENHLITSPPPNAPLSPRMARGAHIVETVRQESTGQLQGMIPKLGAIQVGGQRNEIQVEVLAGPVQQRPVLQVTRSGDVLFKVGPSGDVDARGVLHALGTQDTAARGSGALLSDGGLSVAKSALVGGHLRVEGSQDISAGAGGALQVG
eukprot:jgi/Tetstr1/421276/TSEL_001149.t1